MSGSSAFHGKQRAATQIGNSPMGLPAYRFDDLQPNPTLDIDGLANNGSKSSPRLQHYVVLVRTSAAGQLSLDAPSVWRSCVAAFGSIPGPTGWQLTAGPQEAMWEVQTPAGFGELRWQLAFHIPGEVGWALYRVRDGYAHWSQWDGGDSVKVYEQLERWAEDTQRSYP